jgi:transcriptional regulator with XRE-family HTH domain
MALSKPQTAILKAFGANLRRLRSQSTFTQAALAERVNVELRTVQKFEAGEINPPLTTLHRIQVALGCAWEDLLGEPKTRQARR